MQCLPFLPIAACDLMRVAVWSIYCLAAVILLLVLPAVLGFMWFAAACRPAEIGLVHL